MISRLASSPRTAFGDLLPSHLGTLTQKAIHMCTYIYTYIYIYIHMLGCLCALLYMCAYVYIYICMYTYECLTVLQLGPGAHDRTVPDSSNQTRKIEPEAEETPCQARRSNLRFNQDLPTSPLRQPYYVIETIGQTKPRPGCAVMWHMARPSWKTYLVECIMRTSKKGQK